MQNKQGKVTKTLNVFMVTLCLALVLNSFQVKAATAAEAAPLPVSEDTQVLKQLLQGCDDTLTHEQRLGKLKDSYIDTQTGQIEALSAKQKASDTILTSPLMYFLLGMGATALTVHLVKP